MLSTMIDVRIESGIEVATIKVLRQECRKSKIISAVSKPAVAASWTTPVIAARTKTLWSNRKSTLRLEGRPARILGINWRAPSRSEEHTSELQSLRHLVCRLL